MINATSGISCTKNVKFISGISAISGINTTLPNSFQAFYPFLSDFKDRVSNDYDALFNNQPSFGGGGLNTVANTNLQVTTFQEDGKGVYLDEPATATIPAFASNFTSGSFVGGIATDGSMPRLTNFDTTTPGKYSGLIDSVKELGSIYSSIDGTSVLRVISSPNTNQVNFEYLIGGDTEFIAGFTHPKEYRIDRTFSAWFPMETGAGSVSELRVNAGDDVSGFSTSVQWDTSGDFKFGYTGIGKTVADIAGQVMLQTGNMGISTGIGITFAEIGAAISALSVDSDTIVGECFIKYVGGMLSIVIDGTESTPVASAAPVIGAFAQEGANTSNSLAAPGTYGELLFEVL